MNDNQPLPLVDFRPRGAVKNEKGQDQMIYKMTFLLVGIAFMTMSNSVLAQDAASPPTDQECSSDGDCQGRNVCFKGNCVSGMQKRKGERESKRNAAWAALTLEEAAAIEKKSKNMIISGSILLGVGVASMAVGTALAVVGMNECEEVWVEDYSVGSPGMWIEECSDRAGGMMVSGWVLAPTGAALVIPGVVVLAIGAVDKKRIARDEPTIGFEPIWTENYVRNLSLEEWNKQRKKSKAMIIAGSILTGVGAAAVGTGVIVDPVGMDAVMPWVAPPGLVAIAVGIPIWVNGVKRKNTLKQTGHPPPPTSTVEKAS